MITRRTFLALLGGGAAVGGSALAVRTLLPGVEQVGAYPSIQYGRESCSYCGMGIGDARFASAWRTSEGKERHFDDIGCMVNALRRDQPGEGTRFFVHDYRDESWLDAPMATYLLSPSIKTPMAYGVAAVANPTVAASLIPQTAASTQPWAQVLMDLERKS